MKKRFMNWNYIQLASLLVFLITNIIFPVYALSFYEAEVPFKEFKGSPSAASPLTATALKDVLIKISGSEKILNTQEVQQALKELDKYIDKFSYHQKDKTKMVHIHFNENLVNRLLQSTKHPIRDEKRPTTLGWFLIEKDKQPANWVSADSAPEIKTDILRAFERRGMPLIFPLFDLAETNSVSENSVWNGTLEVFKSNSKPYNANAILVGKIQIGAEQAKGHFTLITNDGLESFEVTDKSVDTLANKMLEHFNAKILSLNVENTNATILEKTPKLQNVNLIISGINNMEQHGKIEHYLRSLALIKGVEVAQISSEYTVFKVKLNATEEEFKNALTATGLLTEDFIQDNVGDKRFFYKVATVL